MASAKWSLDSEDIQKVMHSTIESAISAGIAGLMVVIANPNMLNVKSLLAVVIVPMVHGALVTLKKWVDGEPFTPPTQSGD